MSDTNHDKLAIPATAPSDQAPDQDHEHLDDQEKILAGRYDVNYPALLTKDVAGG
jgi:hypothetical protein